MFTRTRYQTGSLKRIARSKKNQDVWEFRYYETGTEGERRRRAVTVGTIHEYPSEAAARRSPVVQSILLRVNSEQPQVVTEPASFGALLARYEREEMPERYSTRTAYQSNINNHIRPRWRDAPLRAIKPVAVEDWLKEVNLASKTRGNIRSLMHAIFNCAERWELVDKNPISLVRVRGGSRRAHRPLIVTVEQFDAILAQLKEPYRTMGLIAGGLGLRISEIVGLQWADFDFEASTLLVQRTVMHGRVGPVKTEYSEDYVPLDPLLAAALLQYREQLWYPTKEGWVFASPRTARPYHQDTIQQKHIRKAGASIGLPFELGWHTFRHSYRSWLDESGTPISVQKELMRHASIQTTMNVYGRAMAETKRQANSNVVRMILPSRTADQKPSDKRQKVACGG